MKFGRLSVRSLTIFLCAPVLALLANNAVADEQRVARLGVAVSAMVTSLNPDNVNEAIGEVNKVADQIGIATISEIKAAAFFQAEARFFINDRFVAVAGFGRIQRTSQLELLPTQASKITLLARVSGVPRHLGLDYYFTPYTSGDFTLRPFVGGGFMDVVEGKMKVGGGFESPDTIVGSFVRARGEGPGFFVEGGAHLMLPSRYSFIVNLHYRHLKANHLRFESSDGTPGGYFLNSDGEPEKLDFSGFGLRLAINMDLKDRF